VKDLPEVWGCATHPTLQIFASAGADKCVRIWDDKKMLGSKSGFEHDVTALSWAQNGKFLAVGDRDGTVFVMDVQNLENLQIVGSIAAPVTGKNKDNWIEDLKFSPQSDKIAVGTHGGRSKVSII
jgi:microtubule-associated protein-like 6